MVRTLIYKLVFFLITLPAFAAAKKDLSFWEMIAPPEDISENGHLITWLFNYVTGANVFFMTLVILGIVVFSYLYSAKRHKKAYYTYGDKKAHILFVAACCLAVFLGIDMNITRISNEDYTKVFNNPPDPKKEDVLRVEVLGQQWMWKFRYAGKDNIFNTADDVVTLNDLRVPINKKVYFQITSKDVIHAFYVPNAKRKVDALPGKITWMWTKFMKAGNWEIACAEMCGTHHYKMQAFLTTYNQEDFDNWYSNAQKYAELENNPEDPTVFWGWKWY
ncbi:MAG: cytochrome c oxidase subunit II [Bacteriovoracaceae bacterium]